MAMFGQGMTPADRAGVLMPAKSGMRFRRKNLFGAPMEADVAAMPTGVGTTDAAPAPAIGYGEQMPMMAAPVVSAPENVPQLSAERPSLFGEGGTGRALVGYLGDALQTIGGGQPTYAPAMLERARRLADYQRQQVMWSRQDAQRAEDRRWQVEDRDAKLNAPQYFMSGRDRVSFDPVSGESSVIYDGPEDYQNYADTLGLQPGQDGYDRAVQDYVLRSAGPTAVAGKQALEGVRQSNRVALRGMPTFRDTHARPSSGGGRGPASTRAPTMAGTMAPILGKVARGEALTPGEQQAWSMYRSGRTRPSSGGGTAAPAPGGPPVGTVHGGYRFKGGDPANKANWERAR